MSDRLIIEQCAPTLAGLKTANLFPCKYDSERVLLNEIKSFNRKLSNKGVAMVPLKITGGFALIYLYRPKKLEQDLACMDASKLLLKSGYPAARSGRQIAELASRFQHGDAFPHEVGLFLGYPPEDVHGFIENKAGNYKAVGCWKVYGDVHAAKQRFASYKKCTHRYKSQFENGKTLAQLTVAG